MLVEHKRLGAKGVTKGGQTKGPASFQWESQSVDIWFTWVSYKFGQHKAVLQGLDTFEQTDEVEVLACKAGKRNQSFSVFWKIEAS